MTPRELNPRETKTKPDYHHHNRFSPSFLPLQLRSQLLYFSLLSPSSSLRHSIGASITNTSSKEIKFPVGQITSMDKAANVVLDIEGLPQQADKCCTGSPKMTRALSRKGSNRMERRSGEEQEQDDVVKKLIIKVVPSQLEQLKMPLVQNKLVAPQSQCATCAPILTDSGEGRNKKFNRFTSIHPRKILLFFATLSSVGTMILIYFTLAINGGKAEA
uniref:Uncharacterized protein n=1 Tax=Leersia perrieri TaxID=77586 RepID=A0A0D9WB09_9ORYZ